SALLVMSSKDAAYEQVTRAGNNIPDLKILLASYLNIRDLLSFEKVVLPLKSLDVLSTNLAKE
ncbi:MAG TPA: 50S ribosomal protein L4, partial [Anaerolineales bacterium]|nr:50S ribosomal protein L4 [Anaerolineales bacterium]